MKKRPFPTNDALTAEHAATLNVIAAELGCPVDAVYVGDGASGPAVFYEHPAVSTGARCACDLTGAFWQECQARATVKTLLARLSLKPGRGSA